MLRHRPDPAAAADPNWAPGLDVPKDSIGQITIEFLPFAQRRPRR